MADKEPCSICGGQPEEHAGRRHAYTTREGDLRIPETAKQAPQVVRLPPLNGTDQAAIGRLLEVLLDKNALTTDEALYILGVGSKPTPPQPRKFFDPAMP